jgi:hypothetical protein
MMCAKRKLSLTRREAAVCAPFGGAIYASNSQWEMSKKMKRRKGEADNVECVDVIHPAT